MIGFFNLAWTGNTSLLPQLFKLEQCFGANDWFPQPESSRILDNWPKNAVQHLRRIPYPEAIQFHRISFGSRSVQHWGTHADSRNEMFHQGCTRGLAMALCSISLTLDWWVLAFTGPMAHLMAPIAASALGYPLGRSVWAPWPGWISGPVGLLSSCLFCFQLTAQASTTSASSKHSMSSPVGWSWSAK